MIIHNNIPSNQIVCKIAKSNKDYGVEFINTESNSDMYSLKIYLRRHHDKFKIRLALISSILAYPALEMIWNFDDDEYELSSRVFHRICDEADEVKTYYDQSMMPASTLSAKIKESVKPISMSHQEKTHIPSIDENNKTSGVSDWRMSLYSGHYPHTTKEEVKEYKQENTEPITHKKYKTREKY